MMGLRESLIITEFISNETHLFRNNPMEPVHNLYIPSILCEFTHEIIVSSSTNHRDIKILKVLKKKKRNISTSSWIVRNRRKNEKNSRRSKRNVKEKEMEILFKSFLIINFAVANSSSPETSPNLLH